MGAFSLKSPPWIGGVIRYQPTSASAAAWRALKANIGLNSRLGYLYRLRAAVVGTNGDIAARGCANTGGEIVAVGTERCQNVRPFPRRIVPDDEAGIEASPRLFIAVDDAFVFRH
jgi:hypothetical protein